jgi:hypothetical protein
MPQNFGVSSGQREKSAIFGPQALQNARIFGVALRGGCGEHRRVRRLGKNHGGYFGETIDVRAVLRDLQAAAQEHGWSCESFHQTGGLGLWALHRPVKQPAGRVYLSAGIHGDEPAGPLAMRQLLQADAWPERVECWLCPCLNPAGFARNARENAEGRDLNRDYRHRETGEVAAHVRWLERQPGFDAAFCLHEDWEAQGFYLYELNPGQRPSPAARMIAAVAAVCPIDLSPVIEGRPAQGGIIHPTLNPADRPLWPEAFWLLQNKTPQVWTLEAPSDFPLEVRVRALVTAVQTALAHCF